MQSLSEETRQFISTLPASYRNEHRLEAMNAHALLAHGRQGVLALGVFEDAANCTGICIIADDRPGLLATISEAIVRCGFDVFNAEAYTRRVDQLSEAVDLFWLRRVDGEETQRLQDADVVALRDMLTELLTRADLPASEFPPARPGVSTSASRVRFIEDEDGALSTLEIETEDRSGLLLAVSRALFAQRVQVISCEVRTQPDRRVVDRFKIAEQDGSAVDPSRRLQVQIEVLGALEPAKRLQSSSPPPDAT